MGIGVVYDYRGISIVHVCISSGVIKEFCCTGVVQGSRIITVVQLYRCSTEIQVVVYVYRATSIVHMCRSSGVVKEFMCTGVVKCYRGIAGVHE